MGSKCSPCDRAQQHPARGIAENNPACLGLEALLFLYIPVHSNHVTQRTYRITAINSLRPLHRWMPCCVPLSSVTVQGVTSLAECTVQSTGLTHAKFTREELGHSVAGCARTTGHDCARTNPSRVESVVAISAEKKLISW